MSRTQTLQDMAKAYINRKDRCHTQGREEEEETRRDKEAVATKTSKCEAQGLRGRVRVDQAHMQDY